MGTPAREVPSSSSRHRFGQVVECAQLDASRAFVDDRLAQSPGCRLSRRRRFMARSTCHPSIPGSRMSSSTASGVCFRCEVPVRPSRRAP